jgi:hypothetical protein
MTNAHREQKPFSIRYNEKQIRNQKIKKVAENCRRQKSSLRQIAKLLAFHNMSSKEIFFLDASSFSTCPPRRSSSLMLQVFQGASEIRKLSLSCFRICKISYRLRKGNSIIGSLQ